jgi:centrin-1
MKTKPSPLNTEQIRDLREAFNVLDTEKTGFIETRDLKVAFRALGYEPKKDEIRSIVSKLDQRAYEAGRLPAVHNGT